GQAPPSSDYVPGLEHPPSPDYVLGPKEPEQEKLSPDYVPELKYPEYLVPFDAEAPIEDHPLPYDASPTALSSGYVANSDPEEDPEEDPKEDPVDYPSDVGDDNDDDESSNDDDDDDDDDDEEEEEEEEDEEEAVRIRLRAASPPTHHLSKIPSPPLLLPSTTHRDDIHEADMPLQKRAHFTVPTGRFEVEESSPVAATRQLGLDVATVDTTPGRTMYREVGYGIEDVWDDMVGDMEERASTTIKGLSQRVTNLSTTLARDTYEIYIRLKDAQDDRALQRASVNTLFRDMQYHLHTAMLLESEARNASCDIGGSDFITLDTLDCSSWTYSDTGG
ncbi:hypothetical protein Tco_1480764, partial [Tanacetum coccineum]